MLLIKRSLLFIIIIFVIELIFEYFSNNPLNKAFIVEEAIDSIIKGFVFFLFLFLLNKKSK
jgi:hypothetical protein